MRYRTIHRRVDDLERNTRPSGDAGGEYVADIAGEAGRYWIDGHEVDAQTFHQRAPRGPYVVDIGEEAVDAQP